MYALNNTETIRLPNDIVRRYLDLYRFIGRNEEMLKIVEEDFSTLLRRTIATDAFYLAAFHGVEVSETRRRRILEKDVKPRSRSERILKRMKDVFRKIHGETETFELFDRELYDLLHFLFEGTTPKAQLQYAKSSDAEAAPASLLSSGQKTKRQGLETLIKTYNPLEREDAFEPGLLATNFYVDFINLRPFKVHNDIIGLVVLYILLLVHEYEAFCLSSFFEKLFKKRNDFKRHVTEASQHWSEGLSDTLGLHRFLVDITLECYRDVQETLRNYTFDQQLNKSDNIENIIHRFDEVFTKEDIRKALPTVSDSTIDRTLRRLREEKKIRPLGKGRGAKWMKLMHTRKKQIHEQLNLKL